MPLSRIIFTFFFVFYSIASFSQGTFSGDLFLNTAYYLRDSTRSAINTPHYDNQFYSADGWLTLNYAVSGFNFRVHYDLFNNSALFNPQNAYSDEGIGFWQASKEIGGLTITGGYFYDQFGTGIIFRAYEDRGLGVDNAIKGIHLKYNITDKFMVKGFTGRQKNFFDVFSPVLKGLNTEYTNSFTNDILITPGAGVVNRTIDRGTMNVIASEIQSYEVRERFVPKYNTFVYSIYNSLYLKDFSWYVEYAGKTREAVRSNNGKLINVPGSVIYTNLTYSLPGFGTTLQFKRTENFSFRISPNEQLLRGLIGFLPPLTKQNSYRLLSRYNAATQEMAELAFEGDLVYTPVPGYTLTLNYSDVRDFSERQLFRETYGDLKWKPQKNIDAITGLQYVFYNREVYESKPEKITTITPFADLTYKLTRRKSLRSEIQYQHTKEDYGGWLYALFEYSVAPRYTFSVSDMYNISPKKTDDLHYYSVSGSYTAAANKFILSYVKQVEGIICTGGVCRYEPAFSGIRLTVSSTF